MLLVLNMIDVTERSLNEMLDFVEEYFKSTSHFGFQLVSVDPFVSTLTILL